MRNALPFINGTYRSLAAVVAVAMGICAGESWAQSTAEIRVQANRLGAEINPAMWGVFFEDINFGADGGLYAEMIKNRGFEFPDALMGWKKSGAGEIEVRTDEPFHEANAHYVRVKPGLEGAVTLVNEGFHGMGVKADARYDLSLMARGTAGAGPVLRVELLGAGDLVVERVELKLRGEGWQKAKATLRPSSTEAAARLRLSVQGPGAVDLDMISLFPRDTWKKRPGGLRADLVQMLADLKPGFVRFPGGCIVEGRYLTNRYQWKDTIGPVETRPVKINRWNDEFRHRPAPDYFQSFGLGFFEFFQMCEDIGAQAMPILNCGMACQFNSSQLAPMEELDTYIQDALDLIEFANGPTESKWGSVRAMLGHAKPFGLKMLGVGNEQWGPQYIERYAQFHKVLKEKHPEILLISSAGPGPADDKFKFAWPKLRELGADIVDEHCYAAPKWFWENAHRYDSYDRNGPKVFMGEYAAQTVGIARPDNRNTLECAIAEAAYMIGMERNADVVRLASYAPLFGHTEGWQWTPNLIWCDDLSVYATPSYYAQQLFSLNRGKHVLPTETKASEGSPVFGSAVREGDEVILKVVNAGPSAVQANVMLEGAGRIRNRGELTVLIGEPAMDNTLAEPKRIAPRKERMDGLKERFVMDLKPWSLNVVRVECKQ